MMVIRDIQYALRLLAKKPGFTLLTTAVMAAGVGLSVFLFSMFNTMIFKNLPFQDSEYLVRFHITENGAAAPNGINAHDYQDIKSELNGIELFGAYRNINVNASGADGARRYRAATAEPTIFQLSRTRPQLGREFAPEEHLPGAEEVVVIGHDVWQAQFGGDENVIDQLLRINGKSHRVIGVMPQGYFFPDNTDMWLPLRQHPSSVERGKGERLFGAALLAEGYTHQDINGQLAVIMQRLAERYPLTNTGQGVYVDAFQRGVEREGIAVVYSMEVAAILILCLAAINVGNLLYSRAIERGKETAIRVALGAPRSRLISQMLWESVVICCLGGVIGLLVLAWGLEVAAATVATFFVDKPAFWWKFGIDEYTLTIFVIFVLGAILATGLLPAWKNSATDFNAVLRDGTRGALGKKAGKMNRSLVISEIFLSMTVLIAAASMVVGAYKSTHADFGVKTHNIVTAKIVLSDSTYNSPATKAQFARALEARLSDTQGVGDVMIATTLPADWSWVPRIEIEGRETTQHTNAYAKANFVMVAPDTLGKLGIELTAGRYFNDSDDSLGKTTIIVSDSFVTAHFPNETPLGKRVRVVDPEHTEWLTIVGVVRHTIYGDANNESSKTPSIFRAYGQAPKNNLTLAVAMKSDRATVVRKMRESLAAIDPELPMFQVEDYADKITRNAAPIRFISVIFLIFGLAAVVLAGSGIYGVMSNTISQRTQEIGVKRALGAQDQEITREFLSAGIKQLLWGGIPGAAAGCAMGFAMAKSIGIASADLVIIALSMIGLIACVVILATYIPTRRALQMEPNEALRYEY